MCLGTRADVSSICSRSSAYLRSAGRSRIARPGLLANIAVGGAAALILCWTFALPMRAVDTRSLEAVSLAAAFIGLITARVVTNEGDKRALRAAACMASMSPAAESDTARAIEIAQPFAAYSLARDLLPRHFCASVKEAEADRHSHLDVDARPTYR